MKGNTRVGSNKQAKKPLAGIRILDLTHVVAGPYCTMLLADLGAEVIKVEPPPTIGGMFAEAADRNDPIFIAYNRNKKSISLNLKTEEGKRVFFNLVKKADVVVDNFRAGVLERLGIDYERLRTVNPKIISCSITGFGNSGPLKDSPAFDYIIQAMSGGMTVTGEPGGPPLRTGAPIADGFGGLLGAFGILAAYIARQTTGESQRVDISLLDGQISLLSEMLTRYFATRQLPERTGIYSSGRHRPEHRLYKAKDGYIVVATGTANKSWHAFCKATGFDELALDDRFNTVGKRSESRSYLEPIFEKAFLGKTVAEWLSILRKAGVPCGRVYNLDEATANPQVLHRNMIVTLKYADGREAKVIGNPVKISSCGETYDPPPEGGEHTSKVLSDLLGYSKEEIAKSVGGSVAGSPDEAEPQSE